MINVKKYIAKYFIRSSRILELNNIDTICTMQFFQRNNNVIFCGFKEAINILKKDINFNTFKIRYLEDGSKINSMDIVFELSGFARDIIIYEGILDGIFSRLTTISTNANSLVLAAKNKKIIMMLDRADHFLMQPFDGYAAKIGGIVDQVTNAHFDKWSINNNSVGTIPHSLIQIFNGDLIKTLKMFEKSFPTDKLIALVDFNNDVIGDSIKVVKYFGTKIYGIRVDTSPNVTDISQLGTKYKGVNSKLIKNLKNELIKLGHPDIKIIVSSGITPKKINDFEIDGAPIDYYGVGSYFLDNRINFTGDMVLRNGEECAKYGRKYRKSANLKIYK